MSRINRRPVVLPAGVLCETTQQKVTIKNGAKSLSMDLPSGYALDISPAGVLVVPPQSAPEGEASVMCGSLHRLVSSMVHGVTKGFEKNIELVGVGYKAALQGQDLRLSLGYSHDIVYKLPQGITVVMEKPTLFKVMGADKQQVGQVSSELSRYRPPEPYKGKGVHIAGTFVRRKAGKSK